jgi:hypothetical protein
MGWGLELGLRLELVQGRKEGNILACIPLVRLYDAKMKMTMVSHAAEAIHAQKIRCVKKSPFEDCIYNSGFANTILSVKGAVGGIYLSIICPVEYEY